MKLYEYIQGDTPVIKSLGILDLIPSEKANDSLLGSLGPGKFHCEYISGFQIEGSELWIIPNIQRDRLEKTSHSFPVRSVYWVDGERYYEGFTLIKGGLEELPLDLESEVYLRDARGRPARMTFWRSELEGDPDKEILADLIQEQSRKIEDGLIGNHLFICSGKLWSAVLELGQCQWPSL